MVANNMGPWLSPGLSTAGAAMVGSCSSYCSSAPGRICRGPHGAAARAVPRLSAATRRRAGPEERTRRSIAETEDVWPGRGEDERRRGLEGSRQRVRAAGWPNYLGQSRATSHPVDWEGSRGRQSAVMSMGTPHSATCRGQGSGRGLSSGHPDQWEPVGAGGAPWRSRGVNAASVPRGRISFCPWSRAEEKRPRGEPSSTGDDHSRPVLAR